MNSADNSSRYIMNMNMDILLPIMSQWEGTLVHDWALSLCVSKGLKEYTLVDMTHSLQVIFEIWFHIHIEASRRCHNFQIHSHLNFIYHLLLKPANPAGKHRLQYNRHANALITLFLIYTHNLHLYK